MDDLNAKLMHVFREIYDARSISQAATILHLSQPTISIYLAKLRKYYGDPLFVRSSTGMEPTPFAVGLSSYITAAIASVEAATTYKAAFDPIASDRIFNIAMTDISQIVVVPRLIRHLSQVAPGIGISVQHISTDTRDMFERGELDIAVGFMPQLDAGFYQQKMFDQHYVCIVSSSHANIKNELSLEDFRREPHIRVSSGGTGHGIVEKLLKEQNHEREVRLEVPNYLGLLEIVAGTELIAIVPQGLSNIIGMDRRIKVLELPTEIKLPTYQVKQHWHARNHHDPASRWMRAVLMELFLNK